MCPLDAPLWKYFDTPQVLAYTYTFAAPLACDLQALKMGFWGDFEGGANIFGGKVGWSPEGTFQGFCMGKIGQNPKIGQL